MLVEFSVYCSVLVYTVCETADTFSQVCSRQSTRLKIYFYFTDLLTFSGGAVHDGHYIGELTDQSLCLSADKI